LQQAAASCTLTQPPTSLPPCFYHPICTLSAVASAQEVEEYEEYDEAELVGDQEEESDPDFTPGDAEDEETGEGDEEEPGSSEEGEISDTNAPYAEAEAAAAGGSGSRRGEQQPSCQPRALSLSQRAAATAHLTPTRRHHPVAPLLTLFNPLHLHTQTPPQACQSPTP
jgi:hypothetical protein